MLELQNISKRFPDFSLRDISFRVEKGAYFILLGESGAGKSMVLETIAGLVRPDSGTILLHDRDITREKIQHRKMGLVFQDHAVFPHLSVRANIAYSLHGSSLGRQQKHGRVEAIAEKLSIADLLHRSPGTLSGGELQRVALGRTLIQDPVILLLDEPLASLDSRLKEGLRKLLRTIHRAGQTILHVTHDYEEALSLGTHIAVINQGRIIQTGTPAEVFHHPGSEFVARFIGVKNFFESGLVTHEGLRQATLPGGHLCRIVTDQPDGPGYLLIRGEDVLLSNEAINTSATNNFKGVISEIIPGIHGTDVVLDCGFELHALLTPESVESLGLERGKMCWAHVKGTAVRFIPG